MLDIDRSLACHKLNVHVSVGYVSDVGGDNLQKKFKLLLLLLRTYWTPNSFPKKNIKHVFQYCVSEEDLREMEDVR